MPTAIILTIFLVSLDAIFVGMSLRLQKGFKHFHFLIISSIILAFCLLGYLATIILKVHISFQTNIIAGIAFMLLGIKTLFSRDEEKLPVLTLKTIILFGLVMSLDAIMATFSLTFTFYQSAIVLIPFIITGVHMLLLFIGGAVAKAIKMPHTVHNIVSAFCLCLVGVLNLADIF